METHFVSEYFTSKPHECYKHGFKTYSQVDWDDHLLSLPHYVTGSDGICSNCHAEVKQFIDPITTISKPITILCDNCKYKLNTALETIKMRHA